VIFHSMGIKVNEKPHTRDQHSRDSPKFTSICTLSNNNKIHRPLLKKINLNYLYGYSQKMVNVSV
jgi:hypothetical protein